MGKRTTGYSQASTDELFDRKEREKAEKNLGWPSCRTISGSAARRAKHARTSPPASRPSTLAGLALPSQVTANSSDVVDHVPELPLHLAGLALPLRVTAGIAPEPVDYVPGNEGACRQDLDRVVSADPHTFRMGGLLVILRTPAKSDLPSHIAWAADFPGTAPATTVGHHGARRTPALAPACGR